MKHASDVAGLIQWPEAEGDEADYRERLPGLAAWSITFVQSFDEGSERTSISAASNSPDRRRLLLDFL